MQTLVKKLYTLVLASTLLSGAPAAHAASDVCSKNIHDDWYVKVTPLSETQVRLEKCTAIVIGARCELIGGRTFYAYSEINQQMAKLYAKSASTSILITLTTVVSEGMHITALGTLAAREFIKAGALWAGGSTLRYGGPFVALRYGSAIFGRNFIEEFRKADLLRKVRNHGPEDECIRVAGSIGEHLSGIPLFNDRSEEASAVSTRIEASPAASQTVYEPSISRGYHVGAAR